MENGPGTSSETGGNDCVWDPSAWHRGTGEPWERGVSIPTIETYAESCWGGEVLAAAAFRVAWLGQRAE